MPGRPLNILYLGIDSLRSDHLSCYGYHRHTSPHIDRLASRGVLFENSFSAYVPTTPGYSSMMTGRDVIATNQVCLGAKEPLDPNQPTLPELLHDNGYACVNVGHDSFYRGFDKYVGFASGWGAWEERPLRKAESLNDVTLPLLDELKDQPFLLFLRHMDPHSPYLAPEPFDRMFYSKDECDPKNKSMEPVFAFKPFADYFRSWMPPGITDIEYVVAQYDAEVAYMDACIARLFTRLDELGLTENTLIVLTSDHGETLNDHDCYFDHHGLYEPTLNVPLIFSLPGRLPEGLRLPQYALLQDQAPTALDILGLKKTLRSNKFDGRSLLPFIQGKHGVIRSEFYITECTWMRKRGWRTPQWKLIDALEPDFHNKPPVELYNLIEDPLEYNNLAKKEPGLVQTLKDRMLKWVERRMKETGKPDPSLCCQLGTDLYIGSVAAAKSLQEKK